MLVATRAAAGFSQRELAERTGVAQPTIARIERGQVDPRVGTLTKLLDACGYELASRPVGSRAAAGEEVAAPLARLTPDQRIATAAARGFDPAAVVATLTEHRVAFGLAGDLARLAAGTPAEVTATEVVVETDDDNLRRLADVLRILGARAADLEGDGVFLADVRSLRSRRTHRLDTSAGRIEVHLSSR